MLSEEQNQRLTEVGAGTPMGELLRRYWMPIAAVAELDDTPIKPVRLMGEDLVLYKDRRGHLRAGRPPLPAPARRPLVRLRRGVRPALQLPRLAVRTRRDGACTSRSRRRRTRTRASRTASGSRPTRSRPRPGCCGPTWGRRRRRWCRPGSPSPGRTASCRSCSPTSPATGSSARRTRIDPVHFEWLHSNWSRALGGAGGRRPPTHLKSASTSSSTASSTGASARASPSRTSCGPSAACACGPTACSPAATSSGACRSTTTTR